MMQVLWYVSDLCACGIVRADVPARQLNQVGRIRAVVKRDSVLSDLFGTDLIVIQRGCVEQHRHWMKLAQSRGIPVVYDLDDDLFSVPEHVKDAHDYFSRPQAKAIIAEMLQQADLVTVSTPTMAEVAQKYTRRPIVIVGNCVDLGHAEATMNRTKPARLTIGWHGSAVHLGDTAIVKDALVQVLQKHDEVDLSLWGHFESKHFDGAFDVFGERVKYHNWAQPMDLYAIISTFDIGLAPLSDTPFNRCKCVTGDTLVATTEGIRRIRDIQSGHVQLEERTRPIVNRFEYRQRPVLKLRTSRGYTIEGTLEHRIMAADGTWKKLEQLPVGSAVKIVPYAITAKTYQRVPYPLLLTKSLREDSFLQSDPTMLPTITITEKWGRLIGYMLGDGHMGHSDSRVSCSTDYPDVIEDVQRLFMDIGLRTSVAVKINHHAEGCPASREGRGRDVRASSRHLADLFRHLGFTGPRGKVLKVPDVILRSPKSVIREFISSLFECDGTVASSGVSFATMSRDLASDVQVLLLGFGIKSLLSTRRCRATNAKVPAFKDYYYISLGRQAADIFQSEIGFISQKKRARLSAICAKPHSNSFAEWEWEDTIASVESSVADVYDVEVAEDHYYLANGFASHNSAVKWMEYSAAEVPCICSPLAPYQGVVADGDTALLPSTNDTADWLECLEALVTSRHLRSSVARGAKLEVLRKYDNTIVSRHWEATFQKVLAGARHAAA